MNTNAAEYAMEFAQRNPVTVTGTAAVILAAALIVRNIHKQITENKPLDEKDLKRHQQLMLAKREYYPDSPVLLSWELTPDKKSQQEALNFKETAIKLQQHSNDLEIYNTPDHYVRAQMLNHISELFDSISRRTRPGNLWSNIVADDGVEAMFYSDFIKWIFEVAPNLNFESQEPLNAYKKQLAYCKRAHGGVIKDIDSEKHRNNPSSTLKRLIDILEIYTSKLESQNNARSFTILMNEVDNNLLGLATNSLNILYHLIDPLISSNQLYSTYASNIFMIDKFISPGLADKKMQVMRNTVLGEWLYQTLSVPGIEHFSYHSTKSISLKDIKSHLLGQHPSDGPCYIKPTNRSGLRPFAEAIETDKDKYMLQIRNLHKLTLEIYDLSQRLVKSSKVGTDFNDSWVYGSSGVKAALKELIKHINDVVDNYHTSLDVFWRDFYTLKFYPIARKEKIDITADERYTSLVEIDITILPRQSGIRRTIQELTSQITQCALGDFDCIAQEIQLDFMESIAECRMYYKKTESDSYIQLRQEIIKRQKLQITENNEKASTISRGKKISSCIIPSHNKFSQALNCLKISTREQLVDSEHYKILPMIPDNKFYSELQRRVFNVVLKKYQDIVNNSDFFWSFFYDHSSFLELQYKYRCLFNAFALLYGNPFINFSSVEFESIRRNSITLIRIFDLELRRFMLIIDQQELLFKKDRLIVLPYLLNNSQDAILLESKPDGGYIINHNDIFFGPTPTPTPTPTIKYNVDHIEHNISTPCQYFTLPSLSNPYVLYGGMFLCVVSGLVVPHSIVFGIVIAIAGACLISGYVANQYGFFNKNSNDGVDMGSLSYSL